MLKTKNTKKENSEQARHCGQQGQRVGDYGPQVGHCGQQVVNSGQHVPKQDVREGGGEVLGRFSYIPGCAR